MDIIKKIDSIKLHILKSVEMACRSSKKSIHKTAPKHFEYICTNTIKDILKDIPGVEIIKTSKSEYPEIKFTYDGDYFAIDVKAAKSSSPAFDLCYLSKYDTEFYNKYKQDWIISVEYDGTVDINKSFVGCYFNKLHEIAGVKSDGFLSVGGDALKVRPINFKDIKSGNFKIKSREDFLELVLKTRDNKYKNPKYKKVMDNQINNSTKIRNYKTHIDNEESLVEFINQKYKTFNKIKIAKLLLND